MAPLLFLVLLGKDYGTTVLLAAISGMLLLIAGSAFAFSCPGLGRHLGLGAAIWINPVRQKRVLAWLYPTIIRVASAINPNQAMIALGSGGIGPVWDWAMAARKLGFVPEKHTDFILSIIGEELGLVAHLGCARCFRSAHVVRCLYFAAFTRSFGIVLRAGLTFLLDCRRGNQYRRGRAVFCPIKVYPCPLSVTEDQTFSMMLRQRWHFD